VVLPSVVSTTSDATAARLERLTLQLDVCRNDRRPASRPPRAMTRADGLATRTGARSRRWFQVSERATEAAHLDRVLPRRAAARDPSAFAGLAPSRQPGGVACGRNIGVVGKDGVHDAPGSRCVFIAEEMTHLVRNREAEHPASRSPSPSLSPTASAQERWCRSYTQELWMRLKRKAAYLPG